MGSYDIKQERICRAAMEIFSERGFEGTTLEAVAESLGYTKQAIYYYFASKEELFLSVVLFSLRSSAERIDEIASKPISPRDKLREIISMHLSDHFEKRGYLPMSHILECTKIRMPAGPDKDELDGLMERIPRTLIGIVAASVKSGQFIKEKPEVLSSLVLAMLSGVLIHKGMPALVGLDRERLSARLIEIILKGISA